MKKITITFTTEDSDSMIQLISNNGGLIQGNPVVEDLVNEPAPEPLPEPTPEPPAEPVLWEIPAPEIVEVTSVKSQGWNPEDPTDERPAHIKVRVPNHANARGILTVILNAGSFPGNGGTILINANGEGESDMSVRDAEYDVWVQHQHEGSTTAGPSVRIRNHDCDQFGNPA